MLHQGIHQFKAIPMACTRRHYPKLFVIYVSAVTLVPPYMHVQ